MRIGIDIDGCLNDVHHTLINEGIKWQLGRGHNQINFDQSIWNFDEFFDMTDEESSEFMHDRFAGILMNTPAREEASNILKKLKQEGHELIIVTGREMNHKHFNSDGRFDLGTIEWLNKNEITYDRIIFDSKDKRSICIENKIEVMVEDWGELAIEISKNIPVLLFENTYNSKVSGVNIIPVHTWYDIYLKIQNLK